MRRWTWLVVGLGLASAHAALAGDADAPDDEAPAAQPSFELSTSPMLDPRAHPPWRDPVPGVPVAGARAAPRVVLIRQRSWLATVLNGEPDDGPKIGPLSEDGAVPIAAITARSIPEEPPRPDAVSDEEIVVWGDRLLRAREAVKHRLEDLGYKATRQRDGRTLWRPEGADNRWKPRVWMDDDGWFTLDTPATSFHKTELLVTPTQTGPPSVSPAFDARPDIVGYGATWRTSTRGQRFAAEARIARQLAAVVEALRTAQGDKGLFHRLEGLPDELDRIWHDGVASDGATYPTVRDRQSALLALWATRTRTRAGETVRRAIGDYLLAEVDPEAPLPPDLVREAERLCECSLDEGDAADDAEGR